MARFSLDFVNNVGDEIDGIMCFDLREAESLKTMSSFRVIPKHPKIDIVEFMSFKDVLRESNIPILIQLMKE